MLHSATTGPLDAQKTPAYFNDALCDAERLLKYAAEIGIDVTSDTRGAILHARTACTEGWTEDIAASLLAALTSLAARLKPVTAESLKAYHDDTRPTVHNYLVWAIILACVIIPASVATFVTSAVSNALRDDITHANALAVKLRAELGPPLPAGQAFEFPKGVSASDVISDLQEYASLVRIINARARKLNHFILPRQRLPFEDVATPEQRKQFFELPVGIADPIAARDNITNTYQDVRYFAQTLITDVSVFYGAISTCILPVLYALLGTCAYLLRTFEDQMSNRTFTPSAANSARFLIAAIGGAVVGLFNNITITDQASIPPLAVAFLVGYAVDVFFAFLEGLLRAFTKTPANNLPPPSAPAAIGTP
ncbi:MAG TPA: hypothetical protein VIX42_01840 [Edaphobacter sp.]